MKKRLTAALFFMAISFAFSQTESAYRTSYYDKDFKAVSTEGAAEYTQKIKYGPLPTDKVFKQVFDKQGNLLWESNYADYAGYQQNILNGQKKVYENNQLMSVSDYVNNKLNGKRAYYADGKPYRIDEYTENKRTKKECVDAEGTSKKCNEEVFTEVEQPPQFPGGIEALISFMSDNTKYTDAAKKAEVDGTMLVQFVIDKHGVVDDVVAVKGLGYGLDEEAVRVIEAMPRWKPGLKGSRPVAVRYTLPFRFSDPSNKTIPSAIHSMVRYKPSKDQNYSDTLDKTYYDNGKLRSSVPTMKDGKLNGQVLTYWPNGKLKRTEQYNNDTLKTGECYDSIGNKTPCTPFMVKPEFIDGLEALSKFMQSNTHYPSTAQQDEIEGTVYVQFVIKRDGSVNDIYVVKGIRQDLDAEAVRVVEIMPHWKPGLMEGEPIKVRYTLPFRFAFR